MKNLTEILFGVSIVSIKGNTKTDVTALTFDSTKVSENSLFVAIKGVQIDGHNYIENAIDAGAKVIVSEIEPNSQRNEVVYIQVENSRKALSIMASNFYGNPSKKIKLIGITGTNGKTTTATLLFNLFKKLDPQSKVGLISTIQILIGSKKIDTEHTTPDAITINKVLADMVNEDVEYCFMEVSSHGIEQDRVSGLYFTGGVFTNITKEHLDYHKTFKNYRDVKKKFFDMLSKEAFALSNIDDKNGYYMLQNSIASKKTYALRNDADFKLKIIEKEFEGMLLNIDGNEIWTSLIGTFNAYNLLAVFGVANLLGKDSHEIMKSLSALEAPKGRLERFSLKEITFIVDFAHNPLGLKNILESVTEIRSRNEKLYIVIGCGGDRDKSKRPEMGRIAAEYCDVVIFTSDNPRNENPMQIIDEMIKGVSEINYKKIQTIVDRSEAIKKACHSAKKKDIVLVVGKGHENYQIINGKKKLYNDFDEIKKHITNIK